MIVVMRLLVCGLALPLAGCVLDNLRYDEASATASASSTTTSEPGTTTTLPTSTTSSTSTSTSTSSTSISTSTTSTSSESEGVSGSTSTTDASSSSSSTGVEGPICGDGVAEPGELCDDGDADDANGCTQDCLPTPTTLLVGPSQALALHGDDTGYFQYTDLCAQGVARGFRVTLDPNPQSNWVAGIQVRCAALSLNGLTIQVAAASSFPNRKGEEASDATAVEYTCPDGQVMVAVHGGAGTIVDSLGIRCAPLLLEPTPDGYVVVAGPETTLGPHGGAGGNPYDDACNGATVAVAGAYIHTGSWINGYRTHCAPVTLQ